MRSWVRGEPGRGSPGPSPRATNNADSLGLPGLAAIAQAAPDAGYCIIGGYMVRMLQLAYPIPGAVLRSTRDADAAVESVEVIGPLAQHLLTHDFEKKGGNLFTKPAGSGQEIEINVLMPRTDSSRGIRPKDVGTGAAIGDSWG